MKNKKWITIILILSIGNVFILSIGHFFNNINIVLFSLLFFLVLVLISPKSLFLPVVLFYLPWSPIMKLDPTGYTFYTIGFILFFLFFLFSKELIENKGIFILNNILLIIAILIYTMIIKLFLGYNLSLDYFMFLLMLVLIPSYLLMYRKKISFEASVIFFSIGIVAAGFSSIVLMNYPHMLDFIKISEWQAVGLTRLSGFFGDANFYSAHILVAIGGLFILILHKRKHNVILLFSLVMTLIYLGFLSVSKMFLLVLIFISLLWGIMVLFYKGNIMAKITIILACGVGGLILTSLEVFTNQINMYLVRFGMINDISSLTTGRSDILGVYISFFYNNPMAFLFGQGLTNVYTGEISNAAHNIIIQVLYQFGIVGSILLIIWLFQIYVIIGNTRKPPAIKQAKSNYMYLFLFAIVCFTPWLSLDVLFADEFFLITTIFFIGKEYLTNKEYSV